MVESHEEANPAADLTDDHICDILARLPAKSLCRFKCVSRSWLDLISHPDHRGWLSQTLSGFFFHLAAGGDASRPSTADWRFASFSDPERAPPLVDPPLSFLPSYRLLQLLDSCNGLLLFRTWSVSQSLPCYVVCNPATKECTALPESSQAGNVSPAFLGFDPAVSSHFHVFQLVEEIVQYEDVVQGVEIYSSETGRWILRDNGWSQFVICLGEKTAYLNGFLHFITLRGAVAAVDTEGQTWRIIPAPQGVEFGFVGHSHGCLFYVNTGQDDAFSLSVYVLEDHGSEEWTLKHRVGTSELFGLGISEFGVSCNVVAVHPDCNLIFFIDSSRKTLLSYDMDCRNVHVICTIGQAHRPFLPYVPLYSETLPLPNVH